MQGCTTVDGVDGASAIGEDDGVGVVLGGSDISGEGDGDCAESTLVVVSTGVGDDEGLLPAKLSSGVGEAGAFTSGSAGAPDGDASGSGVASPPVKGDPAVSSLVLVSA